jgi:hypothetical protein
MIYGGFIDLKTLSLPKLVLPLIASKSTCIWCPMLEMIFNSSVRKNLLLIKNTTCTKSDRILLNYYYTENCIQDSMKARLLSTGSNKN